MQGISARGLLFAVLAISFLGLLGLSVSLLQAAWRAEDQQFATVEARLLAILEEDGLSGLAFELDRIDRALAPGGDRVEMAVWQVRPNQRRMIRETEPGAAQALLQGGAEIALGGTTLKTQAVDIKAASANWALPMADVDVRFGIETPGIEARFARTTVAYVWGAFALAVILISLMQYDHRQRYRRGLTNINGLLDRYSAGETGLRIDGEMPAPELRVLGDHLNTVLPKIDKLMADLRATSAHLAHELKNPLQKIRSNVGLLVHEGDDKAQSRIAATIDRSIDLADSRLESVMQLFRLQADAHVAMDERLPLGEDLVDLVYDHEEALTARGRQIEMHVDEEIFVKGNGHLIGLMIENLLLNAAKYADPERAISVSLAEAGSEFQLRIENGGTLPDGTKDDLTERYAQGEANAGLTGAGLGLSLVSAIAQKHGFTFSLKPVVGDAGEPSVRAEVLGPRRNGDA